MLEQTFLGNSVAEWLIAAVVAAASTLTYLIIRAFFRRRGQEPAHEDSEGNFIAASENLLGRLARRANLVSGLGLGVAFGNNVLTLSPTATVWIERLLIVVTIYQVGVWGSVVARQAVERIGTAKRSEDTRRSTTGILNYLANVLVWSVVLLFGLENLGIDVSTIIAGLGVSGIAIALATQTILGDIIASISLVFDEPFQTGDFIVVGNTVGTVQRIGVRTTRIKALSGELLVVSNNDLLKSRIQN
ncbi:MAG: mechanosensitive ion channel domain-containing protein, partial [Myxococcota bacterium]